MTNMIASMFANTFAYMSSNMFTIIGLMALSQPPPPNHAYIYIYIHIYQETDNNHECIHIYIYIYLLAVDLLMCGIDRYVGRIVFPDWLVESIVMWARSFILIGTWIRSICGKDR